MQFLHPLHAVRLEALLNLLPLLLLPLSLPNIDHSRLQLEMAVCWEDDHADSHITAELAAASALAGICLNCLDKNDMVLHCQRLHQDAYVKLPHDGLSSC